MTTDCRAGHDSTDASDLRARAVCNSSRLSFTADGWLRDFRFSPRNVILTTMQEIICQCIACGLSDKEIAFFLGIGCATVKAHTSKVLRAVGLVRRTQLVRLVFENGNFDPEMVEIEMRRRSALVGRRKRREIADISASLART